MWERPRKLVSCRRILLCLSRLHSRRLQKTLRIDVDIELDRALGLRRGGEPFAQISREIESARRFDQQAQAVTAAHQSKRRFGGAEHAHVVAAARRAPAPGRKFVSCLSAPETTSREPSERRIMRLLAHLDLGGVERLAILRDQRAHHRMLGLMGLQIAAADAGIAAGAADHLMQQLKGAFGGARIAIVQAEIGVDDADQIELRE